MVPLEQKVVSFTSLPPFIKGRLFDLRWGWDENPNKLLNASITFFLFFH
ncbi:MAG: hypothetical protein K0R08_2267 [Solimicrobium sp.]|nr:hypothetical protein [Solimicrobium sp.]